MWVCLSPPCALLLFSDRAGTGLLVNGRWSGECKGTFVATRQKSETERGQSETEGGQRETERRQSETEGGQRHAQGIGGSVYASKETHSEKDRGSEWEKEDGHTAQQMAKQTALHDTWEQQTARHGEEADQSEPSHPAPRPDTCVKERGTEADAPTARETQGDIDAETATTTLGGVPAGAWQRLLWWVEREHGVETARHMQLLARPRQNGTAQPEELAALRARVQELEAAVAAKQSQ